MIINSNNCVDCGEPLPLTQTMFRAAGSRGVRCETCELAEVNKQEGERAQAQRMQKESSR